MSGISRRSNGFLTRVWQATEEMWVKFLARILFTFLLGILFFLGNWIIQPAIITLHKWQFLLLIYIATLGLLAIASLLLKPIAKNRRHVNAHSEVSTVKAPWQQYRQDRFFDFDWHWDYTGVHLSSFHIICPTCKAEPRLNYIHDIGKSQLQCVSCGKVSNEWLPAGHWSGLRDWLAGKVGQVIRQKKLAPDSFIIS